MRTLLVIASVVGLSIGSTGCAPLRPPRSPAPPAPPPAPAPLFDAAPVSFVVAGPRFTPGEVTIVRVCIAPDRSVISADIIESSGDKRFDDHALVWARQVRVRAAAGDGSPDGEPLASCGEVRVEIRVPTEPRVVSGADAALS